MGDELLKFFEAAKSLINYIDREQVFDRSADMGCGGFDTYQSETFYELIASAKNALREYESARNDPGPGLERISGPRGNHL